MKGRIYADQKCFLCGGTLVHDENRDGCFCGEHPQVCATEGFMVRFGREVSKRFRYYPLARQFLNGLRWETHKGVFDARDYKRDVPLGFSSLADRWLVTKEGRARNTYRNLKRDIGKAKAHWGQTNIKEIGYGEIEDFLLALPVSDKTRANTKSCLHDFWQWVVKRERRRQSGVRIEMPEFPEISYTLRYRKILSKENQERVLDMVRALFYDENPKIWLGIKWLRTYPSVRPGELIQIRERDLDVANGYVYIPKPKVEPKAVPLIDEDIEIVKALPRGLPDLYFFRHTRGNGAARPGQRFGKDLLYKKWMEACRELGIEDVPLYPGTKHSTITAWRERRTPEEIKDAAMIKTNRAMERYLQVQSRHLRQMYAEANRPAADDEEGRVVELAKKRRG